MRESHKELVEKHGLNSEHFDAVAENLMITLKDMGVAEDLLAEVAAIAVAPQHGSPANMGSIGVKWSDSGILSPSKHGFLPRYFIGFT
jgi:hypothetical protein